MQPVNSPDLIVLLLEFQLLIRRLSRRSPLSLAESHVLATAYLDPACTITEVAALCGLEKSSMSRSLGALETKKLIELRNDSGDSRKKIVTVSQKGTKLLLKDLSLRNQATERLLSYLTEEETRILIGCFSVIVSGTRQNLARSLPDELPLRTLQRGLSRAFGVLTDNVLGSGLTATALHILLVLRRTSPSFCFSWATDFVPSSEIQAELPYPSSTIVRHLKALIAQRLIAGEVFKGSRKRPAYQITASGIEFLRALNERISSEIAVNSNPDSQAPIPSSALRVIYRVLYKLKSPPSWSAVEVKTDNELKECRAFFVETYLKERKIREIPEYICHSHDKHYAIKRKNEIVFLLSINSEHHNSAGVCYDSKWLSRTLALQIAESLCENREHS